MVSCSNRSRVPVYQDKTHQGSFWKFQWTSGVHIEVEINNIIIPLAFERIIQFSVSLKQIC